LRLFRHRGELASVIANVGDLVRDDQMMLSVHRGLDIVADDAGSLATRGH